MTSLLSTQASGLLLKMEAYVHYCIGNFQTARQAMLKGRQMTRPFETPGIQVLMDLIRQKLYTTCQRRTLEWGVGREGEEEWAGVRLTKLSKLLPTADSKALQSKESALVEMLLRQGPWESAMQLPNHYVPGLTVRKMDGSRFVRDRSTPCQRVLLGEGYTLLSNACCRPHFLIDDCHDAPHQKAKPWHTLEEWPKVQSLIALLEAYTSKLADEYAALKDANILLEDQDCIQSSTSGKWSRYEITGVNSELGDGGCSQRTPAACEMLSRIWDATPVAVLRAGFSAVEAGTWIKPHYGMTNTKIKLHLGIIVPPNCAEMRVGNETRVWKQGKALAFDDSFEHEVLNGCGTDRVVFQLVLRHPDVDSDPGYRAVVVDAH